MAGHVDAPISLPAGTQLNHGRYSILNELNREYFVSHSATRRACTFLMQADAPSQTPFLDMSSRFSSYQTRQPALRPLVLRHSASPACTAMSSHDQLPLGMHALHLHTAALPRRPQSACPAATRACQDFLSLALRPPLRPAGGATAVVYAAHDAHTGQHVALKVMNCASHGASQVPVKVVKRESECPRPACTQACMYSLSQRQSPLPCEGQCSDHRVFSMGSTTPDIKQRSEQHRPK